MHADRLIDALGPMRHDMLDQRPGADRLDIDPLVLVELALAMIRDSAKTARQS